MSATTTSLPSRAPIAEVKKTVSTLTVGDVASPFARYIRCLRPSVHPLSLILPLDFFFKCIKYVSDYLLSSIDNSPTGSRASILLSCSITSQTAVAPSLPNMTRPFFIDTWVNVTSTCLSYNSVANSYFSCRDFDLVRSRRLKWLLGAGVELGAVSLLISTPSFLES